MIEKVKQGMRLNPPSGCPILISKTMQECWKNEVSSRPSFENLLEKLESISMKEIEGKESGQANRSSIEVNQPSHYDFDPLSSSNFFFKNFFIFKFFYFQKKKKKKKINILMKNRLYLKMKTITTKIKKCNLINQMKIFN